MQALSLFNGMSCGRMALEELNTPVTKYYSSEIDKYANKAAQALYPDTIQLGDAIIVEKVIRWKQSTIDKALLSKYLKKGSVKIRQALPIKRVVEQGFIDLVTGGFPCQAWSMAGKQLGDKDERGMLFWTMLDIMKHVRYHNPEAHFLIENVKMKKEFEQYITTHTENALGHVHKILINSALVSAQNRNRYYWTSFEVEQPEDKGILLKDIIEHDGEYTFMSEKFINRQKGRKCLRDDLDGKAVNLSAMEYVKNGRQGDYIKCGAMRGRYIVDGKRGDHLVGSQKGITEQRLELRKDDKTNTLTTVQKDNYVVRNKPGTVARYRKLTPRECMRLQTIPERHIDTLLSAGISNTQLYKMTGNGWTVEKIAHILKAM